MKTFPKCRCGSQEYVSMFFLGTISHLYVNMKKTTQNTYCRKKMAKRIPCGGPTVDIDSVRRISGVYIQRFPLENTISSQQSGVTCIFENAAVADSCRNITLFTSNFRMFFIGGYMQRQFRGISDGCSDKT
ncbi:hypothetical protein H206_05638 [Candidatus Electrothrix aarhusensis]|uniref:Uncharacterized protein n=1 Tax=Candidatus Electrothrix aarhusensis TaxID=1859131 RepID=A0A444J3Y6_9BACT|nr:hypothetical protein H206_05638 [Candidatus Electrothrix aarhusensis]